VASYPYGSNFESLFLAPNLNFCAPGVRRIG